ncbi:MAG: putative endonuclease [Patescibacteria group bacterium]|nr:putative endonuclease [Patescibacteria group bacterium]
MHYVYILFSKKDKKLYIGSTSRLKKRKNEHDLGLVKSTCNRRPLILIYYEVYNNKVDAEKREKYLKGGNGRQSLKIQLVYSLSKLSYRYLN